MKKLLLILCVALSLGSCYNDSYTKLYPAQPVAGPDPCDTVANAVTYSGNIKAILAANCATSGCHDAATMESGYDMGTYQGAYDAAQSPRFLRDIEQVSGTSYSPMPKGAPPLPLCDQKQIIRWVHDGAKNN